MRIQLANDNFLNVAFAVLGNETDGVNTSSLVSGEGYGSLAHSLFHYYAALEVVHIEGSTLETSLIEVGGNGNLATADSGVRSNGHVNIESNIINSVGHVNNNRVGESFIVASVAAYENYIFARFVDEEVVHSSTFANVLEAAVINNLVPGVVAVVNAVGRAIGIMVNHENLLTVLHEFRSGAVGGYIGLTKNVEVENEVAIASNSVGHVVVVVARTHVVHAMPVVTGSAVGDVNRFFRLGGVVDGEMESDDAIATSSVGGCEGRIAYRSGVGYAIDPSVGVTSGNGLNRSGRCIDGEVHGNNAVAALSGLVVVDVGTRFSVGDTVPSISGASSSVEGLLNAVIDGEVEGESAGAVVSVSIFVDIETRDVVGLVGTVGPGVGVASGSRFNTGGAVVDGEVHRNNTVATLSGGAMPYSGGANGVGSTVPSVGFASRFGDVVAYRVVDGEVEGNNAIATNVVQTSEGSGVVISGVGLTIHPSVAVASGFNINAGGGVLDGEVERYNAVATIGSSTIVGVDTRLGVGEASAVSPSVAIASLEGSSDVNRMFHVENESYNAIATEAIGEGSSVNATVGVGLTIPSVAVATFSINGVGSGVENGECYSNNRVAASVAGEGLSVAARYGVGKTIPGVAIASLFNSVGVNARIDGEVEEYGAVATFSVGSMLSIYAAFSVSSAEVGPDVVVAAFNAIDMAAGGVTDVEVEGNDRVATISVSSNESVSRSGSGSGVGYIGLTVDPSVGVALVNHLNAVGRLVDGDVSFGNGEARSSIVNGVVYNSVGSVGNTTEGVRTATLYIIYDNIVGTVSEVEGEDAVATVDVSTRNDVGNNGVGSEGSNYLAGNNPSVGLAGGDGDHLGRRSVGLEVQENDAVATKYVGSNEGVDAFIVARGEVTSSRSIETIVYIVGEEAYAVVNNFVRTVVDDEGNAGDAVAVVNASGKSFVESTSLVELNGALIGVRQSVVADGDGVNEVVSGNDVHVEVNNAVAVSSRIDEVVAVSIAIGGVGANLNGGRLSHSSVGGLFEHPGVGTAIVIFSSLEEAVGSETSEEDVQVVEFLRNAMSVEVRVNLSDVLGVGSYGVVVIGKIPMISGVEVAEPSGILNVNGESDYEVDGVDAIATLSVGTSDGVAVNAGGGIGNAIFSPSVVEYESGTIPSINGIAFGIANVEVERVDGVATVSAYAGNNLGVNASGVVGVSILIPSVAVASGSNEGFGFGLVDSEVETIYSVVAVSGNMIEIGTRGGDSSTGEIPNEGNASSGVDIDGIRTIHDEVQGVYRVAEDAHVVVDHVRVASGINGVGGGPAEYGIHHEAVIASVLPSIRTIGNEAANNSIGTIDVLVLGELHLMNHRESSAAEGEAVSNGIVEVVNMEFVAVSTSSGVVVMNVAIDSPIVGGINSADGIGVENVVVYPVEVEECDGVAVLVNGNNAAESSHSVDRVVLETSAVNCEGDVAVGIGVSTVRNGYGIPNNSGLSEDEVEIVNRVVSSAGLFYEVNGTISAAEDVEDSIVGDAHVERIVRILSVGRNELTIGFAITPGVHTASSDVFADDNGVANEESNIDDGVATILVNGGDSIENGDFERLGSADSLIENVVEHEGTGTAAEGIVTVGSRIEGYGEVDSAVATSSVQGVERSSSHNGSVGVVYEDGVDVGSRIGEGVGNTSSLGDVSNGVLFNVEVHNNHAVAAGRQCDGVVHREGGATSIHGLSSGPSEVGVVEIEVAVARADGVENLSSSTVGNYVSGVNVEGEVVNRVATVGANIFNSVGASSGKGTVFDSVSEYIRQSAGADGESSSSLEGVENNIVEDKGAAAINIDVLMIARNGASSDVHNGTIEVASGSVSVAVVGQGVLTEGEGIDHVEVEEEHAIASGASLVVAEEGTFGGSGIGVSITSGPSVGRFVGGYILMSVNAGDYIHVSVNEAIVAVDVGEVFNNITSFGVNLTSYPVGVLVANGSFDSGNDVEVEVVNNVAVLDAAANNVAVVDIGTGNVVGSTTEVPSVGEAGGNVNLLVNGRNYVDSEVDYRVATIDGVEGDGIGAVGNASGDGIAIVMVVSTINNGQSALADVEDIVVVVNGVNKHVDVVDTVATLSVEEVVGVYIRSSGSNFAHEDGFVVGGVGAFAHYVVLVAGSTNCHIEADDFVVASLVDRVRNVLLNNHEGIVSEVGVERNVNGEVPGVTIGGTSDVPSVVTIVSTGGIEGGVVGGTNAEGVNAKNVGPFAINIVSNVASSANLEVVAGALLESGDVGGVGGYYESGVIGGSGGTVGNLPSVGGAIVVVPTETAAFGSDAVGKEVGNGVAVAHRSDGNIVEVEVVGSSAFESLESNECAIASVGVEINSVVLGNVRGGDSLNEFEGRIVGVVGHDTYIDGIFNGSAGLTYPEIDHVVVHGELANLNGGSNSNFYVGIRSRIILIEVEAHGAAVSVGSVGSDIRIVSVGAANREVGPAETVVSGTRGLVVEVGGVGQYEAVANGGNRNLLPRRLFGAAVGANIDVVGHSRIERQGVGGASHIADDGTIVFYVEASRTIGDVVVSGNRLPSESNIGSSGGSSEVADGVASGNGNYHIIDRSIVVAGGTTLVAESDASIGRHCRCINEVANCVGNGGNLRIGLNSYESVFIGGVGHITQSDGSVVIANTFVTIREFDCSLVGGSGEFGKDCVERSIHRRFEEEAVSSNCIRGISRNECLRIGRRAGRHVEEFPAGGQLVVGIGSRSSSDSCFGSVGIEVLRVGKCRGETFGSEVNVGEGRFGSAAVGLNTDGVIGSRQEARNGVVVSSGGANGGESGFVSRFLEDGPRSLGVSGSPLDSSSSSGHIGNNGIGAKAGELRHGAIEAGVDTVGGVGATRGHQVGIAVVIGILGNNIARSRMGTPGVGDGIVVAALVINNNQEVSTSVVERMVELVVVPAGSAIDRTYVNRSKGSGVDEVGGSDGSQVGVGHIDSTVGLCSSSRSTYIFKIDAREGLSTAEFVGSVEHLGEGVVV